MEKKRVDELKDQLKKGLDVLDNVDVEEITDEDLEEVAGGAAADLCSLWCCSRAD